MPKLAVELTRRPATEEKHLLDPNSREIAIRVSLQSEVRPELASLGYLDPDSEKLDMLVYSLGGALAERQCELYGDRHNPDQIAKEALRLLKKLKVKAAKANAGLLKVVGEAD